jgi:hypothetical protein
MECHGCSEREKLFSARENRRLPPKMAFDPKDNKTVVRTRTSRDGDD